MNWLKAGLLIFETFARVVDRIGPVKFEPMEKHPSRAADDHTPSIAVDPPTEYDAGGRDESVNDDNENGMDDGLAP